MPPLLIRPCTRDTARAFCKLYHSHHKGKTQAADIFRLSAFFASTRVAVLIAGQAGNPALGHDEIWEVTRVCCGPYAPKYTASRLLGAIGRVMDGAGVQLGISYTRVDERGTSYLAANWIPVFYSLGREHNTGNRRERKGQTASTEIVDRVRWERGPLAPTREPNVMWDEHAHRWVRVDAGHPLVAAVS